MEETRTPRQIMWQAEEWADISDWDRTLDADPVCCACDMLEYFHGDIEAAERHTDWLSPYFADRTFTILYCRTLYDKDTAEEYKP